MNGTPQRYAGAWPNTPQTIHRRSNGGPHSPNSGRKLPDISTLKKPAAVATDSPPQEPLIPVDVVDAATQRLLVVAFYSALWSWRLYNFYNLLWSGENESLWLFMKWTSIDSLFLFGLPALRIPWLEFSSPSITVIFLAHVLFNGCLMFQIGLPVRMWFWALVKMMYDRETSISDRSVKPSELFRDDHLLSGKHIIHILPEGSAYLNPQHHSFCIGGAISSVELPIQINQTSPISLELLRRDLDTQEVDSLSISSSALKKAKKAAEKNAKHHKSEDPLILRFPVKKTGLYTIRRLIDESRLEVRPRPSEAVVVECPQARVLPTNDNKCRGELSNISFEVIGTPPMRVKYRRMVNDNSVEASFQSVQPDDFVSPLARHQQQVLATKDELQDASWARSRRVIVPINETLTASGSWWYAVDQVQDALGNKVSYDVQPEDYDRGKSKLADTQHVFTVHNRPILSLRSFGDQPSGCDSQHPLKVAIGAKETLPVKFSSTSKQPILDTVHNIEYQFTPQASLRSDGEHNPDTSQIKQFTFKSPDDSLSVSEAGLYSLNSVETAFCAGEIEEPATCMLENPPRPSVEFSKIDIKDKCQDKPIGLRISLDLVGSPPFQVDYIISRKGGRSSKHMRKQINGLRDQIDLTPIEAGEFTYKFNQISDRYYQAVEINQQFEQVVKPAASAYFQTQSLSQPLCLLEQAIFPVRLGGEGPWKLRYEIIHAGRREKRELTDLNDDQITISTGRLHTGGEYRISITSVEAGGCAEDLNEEVSFTVRYQKPRAGFGHIDGKRTIRTLEGKTLGVPIRLSGEKPWSVELKKPDGDIAKLHLTDENSRIDTLQTGTYELVGVNDKTCPGEIDEDANSFTIDWIERPGIKLPQDGTIEAHDGRYIKKEVCEGDEDSFDLGFQGHAPFDLIYEEHAKPDQGPNFMRKKSIHAALGSASIQLETSKAGQYEYKLVELSDQNYDHDPKIFSPLLIQQRVNPRPTAKFTHPGKTYKFCSSKETEESIPISFTGVAPFHVEIEIKNAGSARPDVLPFPNIPTSTYNLKIPSRFLRDGQSRISIRKVRDSRGCESDPALSATVQPSIQIAVHEAPAIVGVEAHDDYCVGEYINFRLSGTPPFEIFYTFKGKARQATSASQTFRRIIDEPGEFKVQAVSDAASDCKSPAQNIVKHFHPKPRGSVSKGRVSRKDIHEGGEDEMFFDFEGTPPFEFTYVRSNGGKKGAVLETKTETTDEKSVKRMVGAEGEYELVSLKDRWCLTSKSRAPGTEQKMLTN